MTDISTTPPTSESAPAQDPTETPAKPETDWKAEAKKWESRAKENKTAADKLAAIEEANKTEVQRAADRLAEAEAKAAEAERRATRFEIAAEYKLSSEDAKALEHVTSEDGMREVAQRLATATSDRKKSGNHVPREGATPREPQEDEMREFTRNLFRTAD